MFAGRVVAMSALGLVRWIRVHHAAPTCVSIAAFVEGQVSPHTIRCPATRRRPIQTRDGSSGMLQTALLKLLASVTMCL